MYRILGADNQEYGPVPPEVVRRWIAERRLDARSKIRRDGDANWKFLADFPEFQSPPGAAPAPSGPGASSTPTLAGGRRTAGVAIAAFILGLLAPCTLSVSAIPGLVVGIVALKAIRRSAGQLGGKNLAVAGLVLSVLCLLTIPTLFVLAMAKGRMHREFGSTNPATECVAHLQQLANAVRIYANDNNDRFPTATWCDALQSGINDLTAFQCPARGSRSGYALNTAVAGKVRYEVAPETVVLFESDKGWNAVGDASALTSDSRHGSISVALANGKVQSVSRENISTLRWMP